MLGVLSFVSDHILTFNEYFYGKIIVRILTWQRRIADRNPDWICPKCTTPVTPTTSNIPSQWFGLVNFSSFSTPQAFAPDPQLNDIVVNQFNIYISMIIIFNEKHNLGKVYIRYLIMLRTIIPLIFGNSMCFPSTSKWIIFLRSFALPLDNIASTPTFPKLSLLCNK